MEEAKINDRFSAILYSMQAREGRYWLHEYPRTATPWKRPEIQEMITMPDAITVEDDQCRVGLETVVNNVYLPRSRSHSVQIPGPLHVNLARSAPVIKNMAT